MKNRFKAFTEQERMVLDEALCHLDDEFFANDEFYDGIDNDDVVKAMLKARKVLLKEVQKAKR